MPAASVRPRLGVVFLTVLLDLLGFGIVIPILPLYAKTMLAADSQATADFKTGVLLAVYSLMQLFFSPIWGRLSDRAGRRPVLLLSIAGSCFSQLGYALAPSFTWLVIARGFAGMCGANITAAQAYVADVTDDKSRASGMGLLGVAMGLGFVFGPAVGGVLSHFGDRLPFYVASGLAAANFALAVPILVEPRPAGQRSQARALTWTGLVRTVTTPRLLTLILLFFVITFGFANLEGTFSLYLQREFGYERESASFLWVYIGVMMILTQGVLMRRLAPRWGEKGLVVVGTAMMAISMVLLHYTHGLTLLLIAVGVMAVGNGLNNPALSSLISRGAGSDRQGGVLGVSQSFGALARILGPLVGTWALRFGSTVPYLTAGAAMALACVASAAFVQQPRLAEHAPRTQEV
ncbi:MAG: MFS transporter [Myxococcales bacterium]|nr:MFS transporter [Myxococcales bacterium]